MPPLFALPDECRDERRGGRLPTLADIGGPLDGALLRQIAAAIDETRTAEGDAALIAWHGLGAVPGLITTPFMYRAAQFARSQGRTAFNRLERGLLPMPHAWLPPGIGPESHLASISYAPEAVRAPTFWPFMQDAPQGDFQVNIAPKWFSHGLVHACIGSGWWPGMTEWHVMQMARLNEAIAALHWYWLSELGRLGDDTLGLDITRLSLLEAAQYTHAEILAADPAHRRAVLASEHAAGIATNAIEVLNYEAYAYQSAMELGRLLEPDGPYLELGESCEYAHLHTRRLNSPEMARWREHCLVADVDYATSIDGFEARCARVLAALLTPAALTDDDYDYHDDDEDDGDEKSADVEALRGVRALQDVGHRLCTVEAALGATNDAALRCVADAIAALRGADGTAAEGWADGVVSEALAGVAAGLSGHDGRLGARQVLALGYRPTQSATGQGGPTVASAARSEALLDRAYRLQPALGALLESNLPAALRVIDGPRNASLVTDVLAGVAASVKADEIPMLAEAYAGWFQMLEHYWGPADGAMNLERRWRYRIAHGSLPDATPDRPDSAWLIEPNPYLQTLPFPFDAGSVNVLTDRPRGSGDPMTLRPATAAWQCLVGPGRSGPVFRPVDTTLAALLRKIATPQSVAALVKGGVRRDFLARAVAEQWVLCTHKPDFQVPVPDPSVVNRMLEKAKAVPQRIEDAGPWDQQHQADAYVAYCKGSSLYRDVSVALIDAADMPTGQRIGELGFGTGETTRVILGRLAESGRVVGVDPSPRMTRFASETVEDGRVRFMVGAARALAYNAEFEGAFGSIIANASLWLAPDITDELPWLRRALSPGGALAFSMPAEYLGHADHLAEPGAIAVAEALAASRQALEITAPEAVGSDPALGAVETMKAALESAGFSSVAFVLWDRPWTAGEYLDWVALPVVCEGMCGAADTGRAAELVEAVRRRVDPALPLVSRWYLVIAK